MREGQPTGVAVDTDVIVLTVDVALTVDVIVFGGVLLDLRVCSFAHAKQQHFLSFHFGRGGQGQRPRQRQQRQ